jgi:hypothetical protein
VSLLALAWLPVCPFDQPASWPRRRLRVGTVQRSSSLGCWAYRRRRTGPGIRDGVQCRTRGTSGGRGGRVPTPSDSVRSRQKPSTFARGYARGYVVRVGRRVGRMPKVLPTSSRSEFLFAVGFVERNPLASSVTALTERSSRHHRLPTAKGIVIHVESVATQEGQYAVDVSPGALHSLRSTAARERRQTLTARPVAGGMCVAVAAQTEVPNIGFVLYTKSYAPGTLNARWMFGNKYQRLAGRGESLARPASSPS